MDSETKRAFIRRVAKENQTDPEGVRILLVTVYQPSEEEWEDDWKTRK